MPLSRASLAKAVSSAFSALGDIPESITFRRETSTYVASTGVNTKTDSDTTVSKAVFTSYKATEVDGTVIMAYDVKVLIQQSDISITPNLATDVVIRGSRTYNIVSSMEDPAGVLYILQLRAV